MSSPFNYNREHWNNNNWHFVGADGSRKKAITDLQKFLELSPDSQSKWGLITGKYSLGKSSVFYKALQNQGLKWFIWAYHGEIFTNDKYFENLKNSLDSYMDKKHPETADLFKESLKEITPSDLIKYMFKYVTAPKVLYIENHGNDFTRLERFIQGNADIFKNPDTILIIEIRESLLRPETSRKFNDWLNAKEEIDLSIEPLTHREVDALVKVDEEGSQHFTRPIYAASEDLLFEIGQWGGTHPYLVHLICYAINKMGSSDMSGDIGNSIRANLRAAINDNLKKEIWNIFLGYFDKNLIDNIEKGSLDGNDYDVLKKYGLTSRSENNQPSLIKLIDFLRSVRFVSNNNTANAIVRLVDKETIDPLGTGFFVSYEANVFIVTCSHNIVFHNKERVSDEDSDLITAKKVLFYDFPERLLNSLNIGKVFCEPGKGKKSQASINWTVSEDIALVEVTFEDKADDLVPIRLDSDLMSLSDYHSGMNCQTYGYPQSYGGAGDPVTRLKIGEIFSEDQAHIQMKVEQGDVQRGFSGAPVWIEENNQVIGMVRTIIPGEDDVRLIPLKRIKEKVKSIIRERGVNI